jgi:hypothetical protein
MNAPFVQPPRRVVPPFGPPHPSPSMSEGVSGPVPSSDPVLIEVQSALRTIRLAAENCRKASLAIHQDMTLSEGGRHVRANDFTYRVSSAALPAVDRANAKLQMEINRLRAFTNAPKPDTGVKANLMSGEIRTRLAAMPQKDRLNCIHKAIEEGDDLVVSTVLEGSRFLTNLTALEQAGVREVWRRKRLPDQCARVDELEKVSVHLLRGGKLLIDFQRACADQSIVLAARASNNAANAAIAAAGAATH